MPASGPVGLPSLRSMHDWEPILREVGEVLRGVEAAVRSLASAQMPLVEQCQAELERMAAIAAALPDQLLEVNRITQTADADLWREFVREPKPGQELWASPGAVASAALVPASTAGSPAQPEKVAAHGPVPVQRAGFAGYAGASQPAGQTQPDTRDDLVAAFREAHAEDEGLWTPRRAKVVDLSKGVYATQSHLDPEVMARYEKTPRGRTTRQIEYDSDHTGVPGDERPTFATHGGRLFVLDGHHRVADALRRGKTSVVGLHVDLDRDHKQCDWCDTAREESRTTALVPTAGYAEHARDAWLSKADRWPEDADRFRANAEREHAAYSDPERHSQPGQWRDSRPVGWVRRDKLEPYLEHQGDQHGGSRETIDALADDFRHGRGWTDPIHLDYDQARHRATMSEGNHRWHAATEAGQEYVPVVVHPARGTRGDGSRTKPAVFPQAIMPSGQDSVHPSEVLPLHWMMPEPEQKMAARNLDWVEFAQEVKGEHLGESTASTEHRLRGYGGHEYRYESIRNQAGEDVGVIHRLENGQSVGRVTYRRDDVGEEGRPSVRVYHVDTDPSHRGKGVGTSLLQEMARVNREVGLDDFSTPYFEHPHAEKAWRTVFGDDHPSLPVTAALPPALPPNLEWYDDPDGERYLRNTERHGHYGPVQTHDEARASGWVGPVYHGTTRKRARSIQQRGFRQPRIPDWELKDYGTQEEVEGGRTHETWFTHDKEVARQYAGDDGAVVTAYLHPDHVEQGVTFTGEPAVKVRDVRHAAVMADEPAFAGVTLHWMMPEQKTGIAPRDGGSDQIYEHENAMRASGLVRRVPSVELGHLYAGWLIDHQLGHLLHDDSGSWVKENSGRPSDGLPMSHPFNEGGRVGLSVHPSLLDELTAAHEAAHVIVTRGEDPSKLYGEGQEGREAAHGPEWLEKYRELVHGLRRPDLHQAFDERLPPRSAGKTAAHEPISWGQITERHPDTYGVEYDDEEGDSGPGEEIARAAGELAFDRPDEPSEDSWHHASDLDWHLEHVDPRHIDHDRAPPNDPRVRRAIEGHQKDPESVPPLVLVRRHGVYQVADGHHRASAAEYWGMPVRAYVAHSPHEDEPFSGHDGEPPARGPFHGAEPIPAQHQAAASLAAVPTDWDRFRGHPLGEDADGVSYHYYPAEGGRWPVVKARVGETPDGDLVGVADLTWFDADGPGAVKNAVQMVEVHPDYRRRGIASRLWAHARAINPDLIHSPTDQLPEGARWAAAVDAREAAVAPRQEPVSKILSEYAFDDGPDWASVRDNFVGTAPSMRKMREDIRQHGIDKPISIDYSQTPPRVVDGHTRLYHAEALGLEHVPVVDRTFDDAHPWHDGEQGDADDPDGSWRRGFNRGEYPARHAELQPSTSSAGGDDAKLQPYQPPELPKAQRTALEHPDFHTYRRMIDQVAASPPVGTKVWRGENRALDEHGVPEHGSVGLHWSANPDGTIKHYNAPQGQHQVVWQSTVEHPGQVIPRDHPSWGGDNDRREREAEVRFRPGTKVRVDGAWVFHGKPQGEDPDDLEPTGSFAPMHPERMHPGWRWHPVGERVPITNEHGQIDYGSRLPSFEGDRAEHHAAAEPDDGMIDLYHRTTPERAARPTTRVDTPEYRKAYNRGWGSAKRETGMDRADARGEPNSWYDGYTDYAVGREKWHMLTCTDHERCMHGDVEAASAHTSAASEPHGAGAAPGPTTIEYLRNKEKLPRGTTGFGRDVEPRGRYVIERGPGTPVPEGYEAGQLTFRNPLHVDFGGGYDEPTNWKRRLSEQHGGLTGRELSDAVVAAGHDGIITHDRYGTSEIVDLTGLRPHAVAATAPKRPEWGGEYSIHHHAPERGGRGWVSVRHHADPDGDGVEVGRLSYSTKRLRDGGRLVRLRDMVKVQEGHQRKGIASGMLDRLKADYPDATIDPVEFTADGQEWWDAYHGQAVQAAQGPARHYLRFGDVPEGERSFNHAEGTREDGVSVYDLHHGRPAIDYISEHGNDLHDELEERLRGHRREGLPAHVVTGDHVGFGHDGEPLLNNVRVLHPWADPGRREYGGGLATHVWQSDAEKDLDGLGREAAVVEPVVAVASEPSEPVVAPQRTALSAGASAGFEYNGVREFYHGTSHEFCPGERVVPAGEQSGELDTNYGVSDPDRIYLTSDPAQALKHARNSAARRGGAPRVYEVRPDRVSLSQGFWGNDEFTADHGTVLREHELTRPAPPILDGSHRAGVAMERGETNIPAYVTDDGPEERRHEAVVATQAVQSVATDADDYLDFPDDEDDEDEETASARRTDWDDVYPKLPEHLHRGVQVHLPDSVHQVVHDPSRPMYERAQALLAHLQQGGGSAGLGMHWTASPQMAHRYATDLAGTKRGTPVRVTVRRPERRWVEEDPHELAQGDVIGHGQAARSEYYGDTEVPISHGAPLEAHSISWGDHDAGLKLGHHHEFERPVQVHATVEVEPDPVAPDAVTAAKVSWPEVEYPTRYVSDDWRSSFVPHHRKQELQDAEPGRKAEILAEHAPEQGAWRSDPRLEQMSEKSRAGLEGLPEPTVWRLLRGYGPHPSAPDHEEPEEDPTTRATFFHGTVHPFRPGSVVRPAAEHGRGVTFASDTDPGHAYATAGPAAAWTYAEKAHGWYHARRRPGQPTRIPRVYEVEPVRRDSVGLDPQGRGNNAGDVRSPHGFRVLREMPMPERMGKPADWRR